MELSQIRNVGVIGAGIMGHGIAQAFALGGYEVTLNDLTEDLLNKAVQKIRYNLNTFIEFGMTTPEDAESALSRIKTNMTLKGATSESDVVVEALPEVIDLKKRVVKELDETCPSHTIIASNTSGLSLTEMVSDIKRRDQAIIAHWFNPPHIIPVVEIVKGRYTSDETVDLVYQLLMSIGKKPVKILKEVPGFLGNRLQFALYREALYCLKEGIASAEDIDLAIKGSYGFRLPTLGPLETSDFGGLDTYLHIAEYLFKEIDRSTEPPEFLREKVRQGKLGVKTGEGFFRYTPEKAETMIKERDRQFLRRLKCLYFGNSEKEDR
jgi:3-hydroxybutyryl-CoA dehydrogenase